MLLGLATATVGLSQTHDANASVFGWFDNFELTLESKTKGLPLTISTYDFDGQKIDQVKAKSADIHTDVAMSKTDKDFNEQSSVIDADYGNKRMTHVGSTLIAVFTGDNVSTHQTEMKNATKFVINGHRLFAYRCDYTVYPMSSIKDSVHNKVTK